jgi:hypothetical protein
MAIPGVAEAEVDEKGESPSGVRVRLEPDAEARAVGAEVQRVLADHGMRSRITGEEPVAAPEPAPPLVPTLPSEPPPFPEPGLDAASEIEPEGVVTAPEAEFPPEVEPAPDAEFAPEAEGEPESVEADEAPVSTPAQAPVLGFDERRLSAVAVTETDDGVEVRVEIDGRSAGRSAAATPEAMTEAVVGAVGELAGEDAVGIIKLDVGGANGSQVVTVVVERTDGSRAAGAALIRVGIGYAVARATWAALRNC